MKYVCNKVGRARGRDGGGGGGGGGKGVGCEKYVYFWVGRGVCRWDSDTLTLYQTMFSCRDDFIYSY